MSGEGVEDFPLDTREQKRHGSFLLLVVSVAATLRIHVAYRGGIWADEGAFLLVARAPSWHAMLDFLHFHESHPPLFYALMRVWIGLVGANDRMVLALPILIGIAIVPATYVCALRLFSRRVAVLATLLVVISPTLIENASQIRPYGLLPLLALASSYTLARLIATTRLKHVAAYAASTLLMVYTHNWAWLVVFGQGVAVGILLQSVEKGARLSLLRAVTASWLLVFLGYLPSLPTLLYQAGHAGHAGIAVNGLADGIVLMTLAVPASIVMTFFGALTEAGSVMVLATLFAALAAATITRVRMSKRKEADPQPIAGDSLRLFTIVPIASTAVAIALLFRTDLILPRCLATVTPMVLIAISAWADRKGVARSPIAAGLIVAVILGSIFGDFDLLRTTRSNVREVAQSMIRQVQPTDMVVVAPEWFAPSFDHYFPESVEQIDFPHAGRTGLVDFSDVFERIMDRTPLDSLSSRIRNARSAGRRVWFVTDRRDLRPTSAQDSVDAVRTRHASVISRLRVREIVTLLNVEYGAPDSTAFPRGTRPRYDEMVPFLYTPEQTPRDSSLVPSAR